MGQGDIKKMVRQMREILEKMSDESTGVSLCLRALGAFEQANGDKDASWPNCVPLSYSQVKNIVESDPVSLFYSARENESDASLRARMLSDRIRVESIKRDLFWKFVEVFGEEDAVKFKRAEDFADAAHAGQFRDSGEPYVIHPLEVAQIILGMGMDVDAVITGLLHDSVEDNSEITIEKISEQFGPTVAALVDGVTKLTKASETGKATKEQQQAENVRKMFIAMAKDLRVIPIKLADRLHNMRTLEYCHSKKRVRKAVETLEIYAPLAHRLGMGQVKCELEDLAFMHIYPEQYEELKEKVRQMKVERSHFLNEAMASITAAMEENHIKGTIHGRPKHLYSIYNKMKNQNLAFESIFDLIAIRVIVQTRDDCYNLLGIVHSMWRPLPNRFKDYISTPKPNGYKSLHTTLIGDNGVPFEVQIRTEDMHKLAEYGIASHWKYKEGRKNSNDLDIIMDWVRGLMSEGVEDSDEFMRVLKLDFFSEYVFIFTPQGDVIDLSKGSTPIDFAYRIHSAVGNRCIGAKVNGKIVPLDYELKMGDICEIMTSSALNGPKRDWLNIVKTQQARNKIRAWFKRELKEENIDKGKEMLERESKRQGYALSDILDEERIPHLFRSYSLHTQEDMFAAVGMGSMTTAQILPKLIEEYRHADAEAEQKRILETMARKNANNPRKESSSNGVIVRGESNMLVRMARCCTPVPGDDIVGYITRGRGVSVHRADCKNLAGLEDGNVRFIDVEWAPQMLSSSAQTKFSSHVQLFATERPGIVLDITKLFINMNISLRTINAKTDDHGIVTVTLTFDVTNSAQLDHIIKQLRNISSVTEVYRLQA